MQKKTGTRVYIVSDQMDPLVPYLIAAVVVLAFVLWKLEPTMEGFSAQAVDLHRRSSEYFSQADRPNYKGFRSAVPDADPVLYSDLAVAWHRGELTPATAAAALPVGN